MRSPNCSFVSQQKWDEARQQNPKNFPYVVPEFIVEVRPSSDSLEAQKDKMQEWIKNGARLGWFVDVQNKNIHEYHQSGKLNMYEFGEVLSGVSVLPGFQLITSDLFMER